MNGAPKSWLGHPPWPLLVEAELRQTGIYIVGREVGILLGPPMDILNGQAAPGLEDVPHLTMQTVNNWE